MHLKPLRRQFEAMEECEYLELEKRLPAVYHLICLIWSHSKHYQQPSRLVVLIQEISNLMIELVRSRFFTIISMSCTTVIFSVASFNVANLHFTAHML